MFPAHCCNISPGILQQRRSINCDYFSAVYMDVNNAVAVSNTGRTINVILNVRIIDGSHIFLRNVGS
jgi:hypothetical protein